MKAERIMKALSKSTMKGFRGYPIATIAFYGPDDKKATKAVVGIIFHEDAEPEEMKKWYSDRDVRSEKSILTDIKNFIASHGAQSVVMPQRIIGCPHEEGIDYPEGQECPLCPFWKGRDRWTGERI